MMEFISIVIPAILPGVIGLWFDLADGILQGVIFSYLTVIYIGEVLEGAPSLGCRIRRDPGQSFIFGTKTNLTTPGGNRKWTKD
ncbi:MAG: hypothetical protein ACOX1A_09290 [Saccharofermentanales bacterium]